MLLNPVPLPAFQDNYIWCLARSGQALVVDPGDAAVVNAWLEQHRLNLSFILITHHHPDHTGGLASLKAMHKPVVYGPDEGIGDLDVLLHGDEQLDLGPFGQASVIAVPGHTRGHIAFHFPDPALLFCGDTLFSAGCGRLFEGSPAQMYASLQALAALPDSTRICCTHEYTQANLRFAAAVEPANPECLARTEEVLQLRQLGQPTLPVLMGQERLYNPFLRCCEPAVVAAASGVAGHSLSPGAPVFAALRGWKDHF